MKALPKLTLLGIVLTVNDLMILKRQLWQSLMNHCRLSVYLKLHPVG